MKKNKIIGSIALIEYVGKVAEIRDFVIKKEYQKKGHGSKSLQLIENYARKRKIRKLYALVFPGNQKFFERNDYQKEGLLKHHSKKNEKMVIVSKFL